MPPISVLQRIDELERQVALLNCQVPLPLANWVSQLMDDMKGLYDAVKDLYGQLGVEMPVIQIPAQADAPISAPVPQPVSVASPVASPPTHTQTTPTPAVSSDPPPNPPAALADKISKLSETAQRVYSLIDNKRTVPEIMRILDFSRGTINVHLKRLKDIGAVSTMKSITHTGVEHPPLRVGSGAPLYQKKTRKIKRADIEGKLHIVKSAAKSLGTTSFTVTDIVKKTKDQGSYASSEITRAILDLMSGTGELLRTQDKNHMRYTNNHSPSYPLLEIATIGRS